MVVVGYKGDNLGGTVTGGRKVGSGICVMWHKSVGAKFWVNRCTQP
jgi:hypothetical protein